MSYIENYVYSTGGLEVSFSVPCKHKDKIHSKEYTSNTKITIHLAFGSFGVTDENRSVWSTLFLLNFSLLLRELIFYIVFIG